MEKLMNTYETCEDCYGQISIMDMIVKDTPDGNCIYCKKCTERHKQLEKDAEILCRKWGINIEKLKRETEREERQHLKQAEKQENKEKKEKRKVND